MQGRRLRSGQPITPAEFDELSDEELERLVPGSLRGRETGLRWAEKGLEARRESGSSLGGLTRFRNDAYGPLSAQPFGPGAWSPPCVVADSLSSPLHGVARA
jgi:hypothetical protein